MTRARDLAAFVSNADGDIKFDTDTLFIDSSANRVGIGTTTPDGILDITGSGNTDVYINTGNNSGDNSRIFFGDTADIDVGYLAYDHGTNKMVFGVNAGNRMFIDNSGDVHIADNANGADAALHIEKTTPQLRLQLNGNSGYNTIESGGSNELIIGRSGTEQLRVLSGGGLTFNGDTAASNALSDYEEGTFTPTVGSASWVGTMATSNGGAYVKIGNCVNFSCALDIQSTTTQATGTVIMGGLPYASHSNSNLQSSPRFFLHFYNMGFGSASTSIVAGYLPTTSTSQVQVLYSRDGTTWVVGNHGGSANQINFGSGRAIMTVHGHYFTDA